MCATGVASQVIINNRSDPQSQPVTFLCNNWFGKDVGDGQLVRTLRLNAKVPLTRVYQVRPQPPGRD